MFRGFLNCLLFMSVNGLGVYQENTGIWKTTTVHVMIKGELYNCSFFVHLPCLYVSHANRYSVYILCCTGVSDVDFFRPMNFCKIYNVALVLKTLETPALELTSN